MTKSQSDPWGLRTPLTKTQKAKRYAQWAAFWGTHGLLVVLEVVVLLADAAHDQGERFTAWVRPKDLT